MSDYEEKLNALIQDQDNLKEVLRELRRARLRRGLDLRGLAALMGLRGGATVWSFENHSGSRMIDTVQAYARTLGYRLVFTLEPIESERND